MVKKKNLRKKLVKNMFLEKVLEKYWKFQILTKSENGITKFQNLTK